jgi:hypothetical protein
VAPEPGATVRPAREVSMPTVERHIHDEHP